ncbi:MAG TPA: AsmA family protein, partial [Pseudomonadales bacterium]
TPAQPETEGQSAIASPTIEGLEIRNGNLAYVGADGARYAARDILVDAGAIGGSDPVPVAVKLTARDENADTTARIELVGDLRLDREQVALTEPSLSLRATGSAVPGGQTSADLTAAGLRYHRADRSAALDGLDLTLTLPGTRVEVSGDLALAGDAVSGEGGFRIPEGNIRQLLESLPEAGYAPGDENALQRLTGSGRWALGEKRVSLSSLDLNLDGSSITGDAAITNFDTGAATASIRIDRLNLDDYLPGERTVAPRTATTGPTEVPFDTLADLPLDAEVNIAELAASGLAFRDLAARVTNDSRGLTVSLDSGLFGGRVKLTGSGRATGESPMLGGQLEVAGISPREALRASGESVDTANPQALTHLSGTTRWQLGRSTLKLDTMSWQLDTTRLSGSLSIDGFAKPAARFDLALDRIDLDDYLPPTADEAATGTVTEAEIPSEAIRALNLEGQLRAGALRVMDLDLTNVSATVSASNGVLSLAPLTASLYGGAYQGTIVVDATGASSRLTLDQQLSAVQVGQLLDAFAGSSRISGAMTLNLQGSGAGNTRSELLKALTGNLDFELTEGIYHGMDIGYEIENAQSLLKRTAAPERPNRRETPIRALSLSGRMLDGVLASDDLNADIPYLKLGGKGGMNLVEQTLDYQLTAQVVRSADNDTRSRLRGLGGSVIPLTIKGPMADPKVGVDLQGLVVETVKEKARGELLKRLGLDQQKPPAGSAESGTSTSTPTEAGAAGAASAPAKTEGAASSQEAAPAATEPATTRDLIERGLRGLLNRSEAEKSEER